jgi:hypothetical protein
VVAAAAASPALRRAPLFLETSLPGVFAIGDVRSGATRRVAPSVGAGAIAISLVHQYLAEVDGPSGEEPSRQHDRQVEPGASNGHSTVGSRTGTPDG